MGEFNKQTLKNWAEYECQRQLFLTLGQEDRNWMLPLRKIKPLRRMRKRNQAAAKTGQLYEQSVYQYLRQSQTHVHAEMNPSSKVVFQKLTIEKLNQIALDCRQQSEPSIFLESEFTAHPSLISTIFNSDEDSIVNKSPQHVRPDIVIFSHQSYDHTPYLQECLPDMSVRTLSEVDQHRIAISIVDIKATPKENVGKKHWIELFFYVHALSVFIHKHQLEDTFVVLTHGHGIFPYLEINQLYHLRTWNALTEALVRLPWNDSIRLYQRAQEMLRQMIEKRPLKVEELDVHIQPACGRCSFLDDCKESLGMQHSNASQYDVRLLPYTNASIAEQLQQYGIHTIEDLINKLPQLPVKDTPDPIYPEKPLLMLKAEAFASTQLQAARQGHTASMALPSYSENAITFNLEHDPIHDRVFNVSIAWDYSVHDKLHFYSQSNLLWKEIDKYLNTQEQSRSETLQNLGTNDNDYFSTESVENLIRLLDRLSNDSGINFEFNLDHDQRHHIRMEACYITHGIFLHEEATLIRKILIWMVSMIEISLLLEEMMSVKVDYSNYTKVFKPSTAIFHWSKDPMYAVESLLQRHLNEVLLDDEYAPYLEKLSLWLAPQDSDIRNAKHDLKFYDLKTFVESTVGLPFVLNYTWHEIYQRLFRTHVSQKYWTEHFNYIDFGAWHDMIEETDNNEKFLQIKELKEHCLFKVMAINRLRIHFQSNHRNLTSKEHKTLDSQEFQRQSIDADYHKIAKSWYLYAKLEEGAESLEMDFLRITYPEWSIGKLKAAQISDLIVHDLEDTVECEFTLKKISSNMRIKEGDTLCLVPQEFRHQSQVRNWKVKLTSIEWQSAHACFLIKTASIKKEKKSYGSMRANHHVTALQDSSLTDWYLYPTAFPTAWSSTLENLNKPENSLLKKNEIGTSWLGYRRAYLFQYQVHPLRLPNPSQNRASFNQAEVMMYAPLWLNYVSASHPQNRLKSPLKYKPDPSQERAILQSMNQQISAIQGPPGTGKSQTITALLDELLIQAEEENRPMRILVTAFSYHALHVLLEKTSNLHYKDGSESRIKRLQKVFMQSSTRPQVDSSLAFNLVKSSSTWKLEGQSVVKIGSKLTDHLPESFLLFAPPRQVHHLGLRKISKTGKITQVTPDGFGFDVVIVDEASQMPLDYCLPLANVTKPHTFEIHFNSDMIDHDGSLSRVSGDEWAEIIPPPVESYDLSKVIFVGDQYQLPPVQSLEVPLNLKPILGSAFDYFVTHLHIPTLQLETNYRSHQHLVDYTCSLGLYTDLKAFHIDENRVIPLQTELLSHYPQWIQAVMQEDRVVQSLIHKENFDTIISNIEANLTEELILAYYKLLGISNASEEKDFWSQQLGIVAPHNAHGNLIIRQVYQKLVDDQLTYLSNDELMEALRNTIVSVEKFQGSDRDLMIATMGISATSQLQAEEEFIYDLNRFNVLTSRAKCKMILVCSQNFLDYFPSHQDVFAHAAKIRSFANDFCNQETSYQVELKQSHHIIQHRYYKPKNER